MNRDWMRAKLDDYLKVLDAYRTLPRPGGYPPDHEMRTELRRKEPTVKRILGVLDHALADWSLDSIAGEEPARDAVLRGLGVLDDQDEWAENLSPEGPVLPADRMHPWVWKAALTLWDSGHYRQAVHAAATAINAQTQAKTGRRDASDDKLMQEVFSDSPPQPGKPRLRCPGDPADQTVKSRQRGALQYAVGCFFAIRNPAAHEDVEWEQQELWNTSVLLAFSPDGSTAGSSTPSPELHWLPATAAPLLRGSTRSDRLFPQYAGQWSPTVMQLYRRSVDSLADASSLAQDPRGAEVASGQLVKVSSGKAWPNQFIRTYIEYHLPTASLVGPLVVGEVPRRAPEFQPRAELTRRLVRSGPGVPVARAVTGMPGVGKTQIAAEYARSCIDARWRLVAWVNSSDLPQVLNGLAEAAAALGVSVPGADLNTIGREVKRRLETDGERSLVVFDDATSPDDLSQFIPVAGQCQVIITSNQLGMAGLGEHIPVREFSEEEALSFLAERTGRSDEPEARQLATELGFLPVALAQAAAMIKALHLDYPTYLTRLREQPSTDLLKRTAGEPYRKSVTDAIMLALETAADSDPTGLCRGLVNVVALLSEAGVARALLYAAGQQGVLLSPRADRNAGPQEIDEALGVLAGASLLTFGTDGTRGDTTVAAHRLTMRVALELQAQQGNLLRLGTDVASLLTAVTESLPEPWQNRGAARDAIQQIMALNGHLAPHLGASDDGELTRTLLWLRRWAIGFLNELGDNFAQAVEYGQELITDSEQILGPTHHDTLTARNQLATAHRAAGRLDRAIPLCERTLADAEQVLGPTHPDTLIARNNMARVYRAAGRLDEAIPLYERNLADRERVAGNTDPETMKSRNHLANAYRTAGRLDEAIPLFESNFALREGVLGPTHRSTLTSRNDLARVYEDAGRLDEAIPLYERNLTDRGQVFGKSHPKTLKSRNNLAHAYQAAGRLDEAIPLYQSTLADREEVLGQTHPETLKSRHNLACAYRASGRLEEAKALHQRTLADAEQVLGPDHPDILTFRKDFAAV